MYEPGHAFQYALKMINPLRLSEYKTVNIQGAKHCNSLQELQDFIGVNLPTSISRPDFSVVEMGYIEAGHGAKGRKVWLFDDDDIKQMYKWNQKKKKILLWCYTEETRKKTVQKQTSSDKDKMSGQTSNYESQLKRSEEIEGLCQQLKEKHGSKYKPEQIQTWAHMLHVGTHDTLEEPPNKPFFRGVGQKRPREASNTTSPERKKAVSGSLSPGKRVNVRSELIDQLKKCQELVESGAITQDTFQDLQGTILKDINLL